MDEYKVSMTISTYDGAFKAQCETIVYGKTQEEIESSAIDWLYSNIYIAINDIKKIKGDK